MADVLNLHSRPEASDIGERLYRFPGGLKLRHHKKIACEQPLTRLPLPERLYLPLEQHQGAAGELLVEVGQPVLKGQPLTASAHDRIVPIHASTSGTIQALQDWPVSWPPNHQAPCLLLEPDGQDRWRELHPEPNGLALEPEIIIDRLRAGGLTGLGGAMFPTAAKLRGEWPDIHTLILNGSECEPYISCDEMLMRERPEAIIEGGLLLAHALGAEQVVIGIEDQMGEVRRVLENATKQHDPDHRCRIIQVTTIYPEGGERQLIQVLSGHEVPHTGLPQDLGLVCLNVATAAAARDCILEGKPVIERIVTVSGPGIARPRNVITALGTPIAELIRAADGYSGEIDRLILGGPMSGLPLASDQIPIVKGSNCILALTPDNTARAQPEMPCINCGECVRVCPASLLPQTLFKFIQAKRYEQADALHVFDCI
ncbi:MAG: electron transport complex subunit RsxC, partial [Pseudomonadota bacterium]